VVFTERESSYLVAHPLGRLATVGPNGAPHVKPVAFWLEEQSETLAIGGPDLGKSQMYRDIQVEPRVSFVVDDQAEQPVGPGGQTGRGLEIRGLAGLEVVDRPLMDGFSHDVIRVTPLRIVAWNVDGPGSNARDVARR
jgi:pyridoxamine 5'-phosphate oxidase family protein